MGLYLYSDWPSTRHSRDGEQGLIESTRGSFLLCLAPALQLPRTAALGGSEKQEHFLFTWFAILRLKCIRLLFSGDLGLWISPLHAFLAAIWLTINRVIRSKLPELVLPREGAGTGIPMFLSFCCIFLFSKNSWNRKSTTNI